MARNKAEAHAEGDDSAEPVGLTLVERAAIVADNLKPPTLEEPEWAPAAVQVTVLLLCDHVYLPADPTLPDWSTAKVTVRYDGKVDGRRTRIACHPTLAEFLQVRGQAEKLD